MNPIAPTAELFAFLITNENKDELASEFEARDVLSATNLPGAPRTFVPGYYAVIRLISADDPFVESLGCRFASVWITSADLFESKFRVIGSDRYYPSRLKIHPK
jgi:hypothetical protein